MTLRCCAVAAVFLLLIYFYLSYAFAAVFGGFWSVAMQFLGYLKLYLCEVLGVVFIIVAIAELFLASTMPAVSCCCFLSWFVVFLSCFVS